MGWFTREVTVTLINDATGETFGVTPMSPDDIPESFAIETTLHIGEADWSVVHAAPRTRAEYSRSGSLVLRLRRVEKVDLRDILFSLPSICDRIEGLGNTALSEDEYVLAEDDWRQLELVSRQFADECDAEIAAIRRIHEQASAKVGWREIHVRRRPDPPIGSDSVSGGLEPCLRQGCTPGSHLPRRIIADRVGVLVPRRRRVAIVRGHGGRARDGPRNRSGCGEAGPRSLGRRPDRDCSAIRSRLATLVPVRAGVVGRPALSPATGRRRGVG